LHIEARKRALEEGRNPDEGEGETDGWGRGGMMKEA
jgi:hypothetical protein